MIDCKPVEIINPAGKASIILACEHASSHIPASYDQLGLAKTDYLSHAAWDIGALDLALALSEMLDAPLVHSQISRLVYDNNRPPQAKDAIPVKSELIEVPGNRNLSDEERQYRIREIHDPFHDSLDEVLDNKIAQLGNCVVLITVHSFTPTYFGKSREVDIGLLHDQDASFAESQFNLLQEITPLRVALNEPYSATDGVTYTLRKHANPRDIQNLMIEINNELIADKQAVDQMAELLGSAISDALTGKQKYKVHS